MRIGERLILGVAPLGGGDVSCLLHACQDRVLAGHGAVEVPVRPQALGGLRQAGQQGGLGQREFGGRLAEVVPRRGLGPAEVPAVGRHVQVDVENLVLGLQPVQLQGPQRLDGLGPDGARPLVHHAADLHVEGAGAGDDAAGPQVVGGRAEDRQAVDARVAVEPLVLGGHGGRPQPRRELPPRHGRPPLAVGAHDAQHGPALDVEDRRVGRPAGQFLLGEGRGHPRHRQGGGPDRQRGRPGPSPGAG